MQAMQLFRAYRNNIMIPDEEAEAEAESSNRGTSRRRYIVRDRVLAHERLMADYFGQNAKYPPEYFKRRFRMREELFLRIVEGITSYYVQPIPDYFTYFQQRPDARGVPGFTPILKVT